MLEFFEHFQELRTSDFSIGFGTRADVLEMGDRKANGGGHGVAANTTESAAKDKVEFDALCPRVQVLRLGLTRLIGNDLHPPTGRSGPEGASSPVISGGDGKK